MTKLVHELISRRHNSDAIALTYGEQQMSYRTLSKEINLCANLFLELGLDKYDRVAVYMEKRIETVVSMFGAAAAGGAFVPVNPLLKAEQVAHILKDCNVRILVTTPERLALLRTVLSGCHELSCVVLITAGAMTQIEGPTRVNWSERLTVSKQDTHRVIDGDMAAILYTSGSTGKPKGVVLSHRNLVAGAASVSHYLDNRPEDRILSVLPLSFDYGLNQLTTAFRVGACVILMNYLFPRDVIRAVVREKITALAAVPALWLQLAQLDWPIGVDEHLRYITNSGGAMPAATLAALRAKLPNTQVFLMYGLTEAFRSTYLPSCEVDRRPGSIGRAIPGAEILVVRGDGTPCLPGEEGELVHRGVHVSLGYWNDVEKTSERFKLAPGLPVGLPVPEMAVWSGDRVKTDEEGFLYFIGRHDDMIKTSGYRVSPAEVEEIIYSTYPEMEGVAIGVEHPALGQAIVLVVHAPTIIDTMLEKLMFECKQTFPAFMVPARIIAREVALPRNPNGKIDRKQLSSELADLFKER